MHRVALKQETVVDLLDGRLSFEVALERFWDLTASSPEALEHLRQGGDGETDQERVVNQMLVFARVQAGRFPERYVTAIARVEEEAKVGQSRDTPAH